MTLKKFMLRRPSVTTEKVPSLSPVLAPGARPLATGGFNMSFKGHFLANTGDLSKVESKIEEQRIAQIAYSSHSCPLSTVHCPLFSLTISVSSPG
jgi:hypothetical protein